MFTHSMSNAIECVDVMCEGVTLVDRTNSSVDKSILLRKCRGIEILRLLKQRVLSVFLSVERTGSKKKNDFFDNNKKMDFKNNKTNTILIKKKKKIKKLTCASARECHYGERAAPLLIVFPLSNFPFQVSRQVSETLRLVEVACGEQCHRILQSVQY
jgi:hypothetical protein